MERNRRPSIHTLLLLEALSKRSRAWHYGYELSQITALKSGTLYPILVRLADREIVEACWEDGEPAGRPRRHLYRLTSGGLAAAMAARAEAPAPAARTVPARRTAPGRGAAPRRLAGEGT